MFDPETAALIRSSPPLAGLDRERLPDELSRAFAEISAARVRLRGGQTDLGELKDWEQFGRRLALTYEGLVATAPTRDDRISAAFVSGTAHQLVHNITSLSVGNASRASLGPRGISSDVAAMLLFLAAEATADANEIASRIVLPEERSIERSLVAALRALARGDLLRIARTRMILKRQLYSDDAYAAATRALYFTVLQGVRALALGLLGRDFAANPVEIFKRVRSLSSDTAGPSLLEIGSGELGSFPGPFHLSSLLISLAGDLAASGVVRIPPPTSTDPIRWSEGLARFAQFRPFLWKNHKHAISAGYLERGVSAAVSFPTGAGKSTLADLKICATLLSNRNVVFLAPTHALVDQTAASLRKTFPDARIQRERIYDFSATQALDEIADILVMTPEACLSRLGFDPSAFENTGLLVFDECHLLHGESEAPSRRAIDAMLCILNFVRTNPDADLLLISAMMQNSDEIAAWLGALTRRDSVSLNLTWKPTRQLRGCVVYRSDDIRELNRKLVEERSNYATSGVPTSLKPQLKATPHGFFSVKQSWASALRRDYSLVQLLNQEVEFATNANWQLTPNSGVLAAELAASAANAGIKTLVFSQTIPNANSIAKKAALHLGDRAIPLNEDELAWLETSIDELGGPSHLYMKVEDGVLRSASAVHHGQLLPQERRLCESLFRRQNAVAILAATSTLAQGMNLPSQLVIIAEDSRFNEAVGRRDILDAHELLNAAGRAGRAGQDANGIVIVIPGKVVGISDSENAIGSRWSRLREVFGQSDQCLTIDDPLTAVLDRIHSEAEDLGDSDRYIVSRLLGHDAAEDRSKLLSENISSTLGAFRARQMDDEAWVTSRVSSAAAFLETSLGDTFESDLDNQVASIVGAPVEAVGTLRRSMEDSAPGRSASLALWRDWMLRWLAENPLISSRLIRPENLDRLFGSLIKNLDIETRMKLALPKISILLRAWMLGEPLSNLEMLLGTPANKLKQCLGARKFVTLIVPELSYIFSIPALVIQRAAILRDEADEPPLGAAQLGRCVRLGLDSYEKAALHLSLLKDQRTRRVVHREFDRIVPFLNPASESESWAEALDRVESACAEEFNSRS